MTGMNELPRAARLYVLTILAVGTGVLLWSIPFLPHTREDWLTFGFLTLCAAVAQLFPVVGPRNEAYQLTFVFVFAGLLLLPPGALALLIVIALIPEWIKTRKPWYIQSFNVGNFLIDALVARALFVAVGGVPGDSLWRPSALLAAVLAAALLTLLNRLLLATVLRLARGHSWREAGLFEPSNFLIDGALACVGIIVGLLWQASPWSVTLVGAPLFLMYKALGTAKLQEQARTDAKTGLYNARHFYQVLREELHRARRFERPLAVVVADMDLLRNINNTYGHLAGDVVLKGVADIIKRGLREYDLAARFGGEEFAILLPECDARQGLAVAERLRRQVEATRFVVATSVQPIRATLSLGIASFPAHGLQADGLIHQADLAVYYAKLRGRNQAWASSPETMALGPMVGARIDFGSAYHSFISARPASPHCEASPTDEPDKAVTDPAERDAGPGQPSAGDDVGARESGRASPVAGDGGVAFEAFGGRRGRQARQPKRASDLTWSVALCVGLVLGPALALWSLHRPWEAEVDWLLLASLGILAIASQSVSVDIHGRGKVSIGGIFVLAGGFLFGMSGALLLAPALAASNWVLRRGLLHRAMLDLGNSILWAAAAVALYEGLAARLPSSEPGLLLLPAGLAAVAYYVVNIGLLCLTMGIGEGRSPLVIWRERFSWLLPYYVACGLLALLSALACRAIGLYGLLSFFVPPLMLRYVMKQYTDRTVESLGELRRVCQELSQAHDEAVDTLGELRATYDATLTALSAALNYRDSESEGHSRRVVEYTGAIARQLGLPEYEFPGLLNGALLHDIGKVGVPDAILRKPGLLTRAEQEAVGTHPERGYQMLRSIAFLNDALPVIRHHHERYDGTGYPDGLRGHGIPLGARVFAVADAFDALTSRGLHHTAHSYEEARREIARGAGSQFDPEVVEAFLQLSVAQLMELGGRGPQQAGFARAVGRANTEPRQVTAVARAV